MYKGKSTNRQDFVALPSQRLELFLYDGFIIVASLILEIKNTCPLSVSIDKTLFGYLCSIKKNYTFFYFKTINHNIYIYNSFIKYRLEKSRFTRCNEYFIEDYLLSKILNIRKSSQSSVDPNGFVLLTRDVNFRRRMIRTRAANSPCSTMDKSLHGLLYLLQDANNNFLGELGRMYYQEVLHYGILPGRK